MTVDQIPDPGAATVTDRSYDDQTVACRSLPTAATEMAPGQLAGASAAFVPMPSLPAAATTTTLRVLAAFTAAQMALTSDAPVATSEKPSDRLITLAPCVLA